jgi:hypothetical protein
VISRHLREGRNGCHGSNRRRRKVSEGLVHQKRLDTKDWGHSPRCAGDVREIEPRVIRAKRMPLIAQRNWICSICKQRSLRALRITCMIAS